MSLNPAQIAEYHQSGVLLLRDVFPLAAVSAMRAIIKGAPHHDQPWSGTWTQEYPESKPTDTLRTRRIDNLDDMQPYVQHAGLRRMVGTLLMGEPLLHHGLSIMKPPETGQPFPLHQDYWYYPHVDERFVIATVYLDDVTEDNGSIRFLPGSQAHGPIPHRREQGKPYLPRETYRLEETVCPQGKAGDVVCASYYTVHGSYPNRSRDSRRSIRLGFRHPLNVPFIVVPMTHTP